jgi:hypothetical protein
VKWIAFWNLIDSGIGDPGVVRRGLQELSEQDLVDFFWREQERADHLIDEDSQEEAAHWVVRQGSRFYQQVAKDRSRLPEAAPDSGEDISYLSWAGDVYHERYGATIRAPEDPPPPNA